MLMLILFLIFKIKCIPVEKIDLVLSSNDTITCDIFVEIKNWAVNVFKESDNWGYSQILNKYYTNAENFNPYCVTNSKNDKSKCPYSEKDLEFNFHEFSLRMLYILKKPKGFSDFIYCWERDSIFNFPTRGSFRYVYILMKIILGNDLKFCCEVGRELIKKGNEESYIYYVSRLTGHKGFISLCEFDENNKYIIDKPYFSNKNTQSFINKINLQY